MPTTADSAAGGRAVPTVTVAVPTFRRPSELASCLDSLAELDRPVQAEWVETLVVDNDCDASIRELVESYRHVLPALSYISESETGVVAVRNTAVASTTSDLLACVDDDMTVTRGWLTTLVADLLATGASAAAGRYEQRYAQGIRASVISAGVFEYPHWPTRSEIDTLRTGNCLLRVACLPDPPFDPQFARLGGEDHYLGRLLSQHSSVIASDAVAIEWVAVDEDTEQNLRDRARRYGGAWFEVDRRTSSQRRELALGQSLVRIVVGLPGLAPIDHPTRWKAHFRMWFGVGAVQQALGLPPKGY